MNVGRNRGLRARRFCTYARARERVFARWFLTRFVLVGRTYARARERVSPGVADSVRAYLLRLEFPRGEGARVEARARPVYGTLCGEVLPGDLIPIFLCGNVEDTESREGRRRGRGRNGRGRVDQPPQGCEGVGFDARWKTTMENTTVDRFPRSLDRRIYNRYRKPDRAIAFSSEQIGIVRLKQIEFEIEQIKFQCEQIKFRFKRIRLQLERIE